MKFCLLCYSTSCTHFQPPPPHLTPKEVTILLLLAEGKAYRGVADAFRSTEGTMRCVMARVYKKLGIHSKGEAMLWALEHRKALEAGRKEKTPSRFREPGLRPAGVEN